MPTKFPVSAQKFRPSRPHPSSSILYPSDFRIPTPLIHHSSFRSPFPHSTFHIPHSTFHIPHSAFRIPHFPSPSSFSQTFRLQPFPSPRQPKAQSTSPVAQPIAPLFAQKPHFPSKNAIAHPPIHLQHPQNKGAIHPIKSTTHHPQNPQKTAFPIKKHRFPPRPHRQKSTKQRRNPLRHTPLFTTSPSLPSPLPSAPPRPPSPTSGISPPSKFRVSSFAFRVSVGHVSAPARTNLQNPPHKNPNSKTSNPRPPNHLPPHTPPSPCAQTRRSPPLNRARVFNPEVPPHAPDISSLPFHIPQSAFRIPHFAFRIPHSAFHISHSAFRISPIHHSSFASLSSLILHPSPLPTPPPNANTPATTATPATLPSNSTPPRKKSPLTESPPIDFQSTYLYIYTTIIIAPFPCFPSLPFFPSYHRTPRHARFIPATLTKRDPPQKC